MNEIPRDVALQLCQEIREENRGKWYTIAGCSAGVVPPSAKVTRRRCVSLGSRGTEGATWSTDATRSDTAKAVLTVEIAKPLASGEGLRYVLG